MGGNDQNYPFSFLVSLIAKLFKCYWFVLAALLMTINILVIWKYTTLLTKEKSYIVAINHNKLPLFLQLFAGVHFASWTCLASTYLSKTTFTWNQNLFDLCRFQNEKKQGWQILKKILSDEVNFRAFIKLP